MKRTILCTVEAVIVLVACVPIALLALGSLSREWLWPAFFPSDWSARSWVYLISEESETSRALATSAVTAGLVAFVTVALATPAARALALHSFRGKTACLAVLSLPLVAPPIAAVMGLHRVFLAYGLTETVVGVGLCHVPAALPYAILAMYGSFKRLDYELEWQARSLGARPFQVWRYVTLPAIAPGMAVALSLAFIISWSEYLPTLFIGGGRVITVPLLLVSFQRSGDDAVSAALALAFAAPPVLLMGAMIRLLRR